MTVNLNFVSFLCLGGGGMHFNRQMRASKGHRVRFSDQSSSASSSDHDSDSEAFDFSDARRTEYASHPPPNVGAGREKTDPLFSFFCVSLSLSFPFV